MTSGNGHYRLTTSLSTLVSLMEDPFSVELPAPEFVDGGCMVARMTFETVLPFVELFRLSRLGCEQ